MLIDSHCHLGMLDLSQDGGSLDGPITRATEAGVRHLVTVGIDLPSSQQCIEIASQYPNVSATAGVHPSDVKGAVCSEEELLALASNAQVVAVGETGLDYYYNKDGYDSMQASFRRHVQVARQVKKPLIIHTREAQEETIRILTQEQADQVGGVMHCFTESIEMAEQAMALGFYVSFSGIVTFKNAKNVQEIARVVPLERMLVETDAPYLAPVPHRGKKNEPAYVRFVAEYLAQLKGVSYEELIDVTGKNCCDLFKLKIDS
jgi:TatD DNase family protein